MSTETSVTPGFIALSPASSVCLPLTLPGGLTLQFAADQFSLAAKLLLEMDRHHAQL
ncbi:MAG: hypothetical protein AAFO78_14555 [Pseudomonadota bacterium]